VFADAVGDGISLDAGEIDLFTGGAGENATIELQGSSVTSGVPQLSILGAALNVGSNLGAGGSEYGIAIATGNNNNVAIVQSTTDVAEIAFDLIPSGSGAVVTGLAATKFKLGDVIVLRNASATAGRTVSLAHHSGLSTAGNQLALVGGASVVLDLGVAIWLKLDVDAAGVQYWNQIL
jgi:hypothetical protein